MNNLNNVVGQDNLVTIANNDYLFVEQILKRKVRLSNFNKVAKAIIRTEGQNVTCKIEPSSYDFLVKDIQVYAFYQGGNFMPNGVAKDLVTMTIKNTKTDDYWVSAGTDIQVYSPINSKNSFTPTILPSDAGLLIEFKHERAVAIDNLEFPKSGIIPTGGNADNFAWFTGVPSGSSITPDPFPVQLQVVIIGAKIFSDR